MYRTEWTGILRKKQIIRPFECGDRHGKISLLQILEVKEPFVRPFGDEPVTLADAGYAWLQLAVENERVWYTVMFDPQGKLVQIYADITDGNITDTEDPRFTDMYLDLVVYKKEIRVLDADELEQAYRQGMISEDQYRHARKAGEELQAYLQGHMDEVYTFFAEQYTWLRDELK